MARPAVAQSWAARSFAAIHSGCGCWKTNLEGMDQTAVQTHSAPGRLHSAPVVIWVAAPRGRARSVAPAVRHFAQQAQSEAESCRVPKKLRHGNSLRFSL